MVQVKDHFGESSAVEDIDDGHMLVSFEVMQDDGDGHLQLLLNILLNPHTILLYIYNRHI